MIFARIKRKKHKILHDIERRSWPFCNGRITGMVGKAGKARVIKQAFPCGGLYCVRESIQRNIVDVGGCLLPEAVVDTHAELEHPGADRGVEIVAPHPPQVRSRLLCKPL